MSLRNMWIPVTLLLVVSCVVCLGYRSETDAETTAAEPLVEAEKRIEAENYYEAILALKPLLTSDTKSVVFCFKAKKVYLFPLLEKTIYEVPYFHVSLNLLKHPLPHLLTLQ